MSAAAHFTANVYGLVKADPPYIGSNSTNALGTFDAWSTALVASFSTAGTTIHQVTPGQQVGNTSNYIYSVIEINATGLNTHGDKFASNQSVATLASLAG